MTLKQRNDSLKVKIFSEGYLKYRILIVPHGVLLTTLGMMDDK